MEKNHQIAIAASSSFIGVLIGIFFLYIALRNSRRKKLKQKSIVDDESERNFNGRHLNLQNRSSLEDRRNKRNNNRNKRYSGQAIELEPLPNFLHVSGDELTTTDHHIYHGLDTIEPSADYPVTPKLQRNISMPVNPVTQNNPDTLQLSRNYTVPTPRVVIPAADYPVTPKSQRHVSRQSNHVLLPAPDYSDEETLEDIPVRFDLPNDIDTMEPARPYHVKRSMSYPAIDYHGHEVNARLSDRRVARQSAERFRQEIHYNSGYENEFPASSPLRNDINHTSDHKVKFDLYYNTDVMEPPRMTSDRNIRVQLQIPEPDYN